MLTDVIRDGLVLSGNEHPAVALRFFSCLALVLISSLLPLLLETLEDLLALAPVQYMRRRVLVLHAKFVSTLRRLVRVTQTRERRVHSLVPRDKRGVVYGIDDRALEVAHHLHVRPVLDVVRAEDRHLAVDDHELAVERSEHRSMRIYPHTISLLAQHCERCAATHW